MIVKLGQIMLYPLPQNGQNFINFKTATEISTSPLIPLKYLPHMNENSKNPVNNFIKMIESWILANRFVNWCTVKK